MKTKLLLSSLSFTAFKLTSAIERGYLNKITFDEIYQGIESGDLLSYLEEKLAIDLSIINRVPDQKQGFIEVMQEIAGGYKGREENKLALKNCGLCLLLAFCIEAMQQFFWDTSFYMREEKD